MKKSASILLLIVLSFFQNVTAQNFVDKEYYLVDSLEWNKVSLSDKKLIDSCLTFFHQETDDTNRIKGINTIVEESWDDQVWPKYNRWVYHFIQEKLKEKLNKKITRKLRIYLAGTINNIGYNLNNNGNVSEALEFYEKGLKIQEELNDKEGMATSLNNIGAVYKKQGDIANALTYYHRSLKIYQEIDNARGVGNALSNIGNVTQEQGDQNLALEYLHKSRNIYKELGETRAEATLLNNIGFSYFNKKNNKKALQYYNESILLRKSVNDKRGIANTYNNIAKVYQIELDYDRAMEYFFKSNSIFKSLNYKLGLSTNSINVGRLFYLQNNLSKAKKFGLIGLELAKNVESPTNIQGAAKLLSDIYGDEGKGMKAFEMYKLYTSMRDSINNNKNQKAIIQQNIKYQYQKEKAIDDGERDNLMAIEQKENEKQQVIIYAIGFGLLIVLLFSFIIYNKLKVTGKQKALIEVQNKEIVDSITYAKRIQEAILPTLSVFEEKFPKSFIYYKPKDIISGDFYWLETSESVGLKAVDNEGELVYPTPQSPSLIFFAVADCTGHGVPGAMVSVVCNNALNSCIKEFKLTDPGEILNKTRAIVAEQFNESTASSYIRDGMDIALCAFDPITKIIKYAGAYNPLWVFRNGTRQLEEIKATRQSVGKVDGETPFKTHTVKVQSGDHIYLFSDGFSDQFGGEKGKKMKSKLFKELLHSISNQSMEEQRNSIDTHFENWRGDHEQVDDVCIMGIRI